jgi:hypothetical protein
VITFPLDTARLDTVRLDTVRPDTAWLDTVRLNAVPASGKTPAERAVTAAAATVDSIGLSELNELAELQTRVDRKYFVPVDVFGRLIAAMRGQLQVLSIDGRRSFGYESFYFDTPELLTYRDHLQRRRKRFKARTRTYTDSGLCMFEVKLTGARGETIKKRIPHPADLRAELTDEARAHLRTTLCENYHQPPPAGLQPTVVTSYQRTTFVSRTGEARLTCDVGLVSGDIQHEVHDTGTHVLVESKSSGSQSGPDRILRELGVYPARVSKYCVAIGALHPELPSNPWHQTLNRYFGPLADAA